MGQLSTGKKTPGGAGTHTGHTRDTQAHKGTRITPTNLTTIQTHQHTTRTSARRPKPRPTQQPQARSRPLPAVDSEEAAPSEPDPASTRSTTGTVYSAKSSPLTLTLTIGQCVRVRVKCVRIHSVWKGPTSALPNTTPTENAARHRSSPSPPRERCSARGARTHWMQAFRQ